VLACGVLAGKSVVKRCCFVSVEMSSTKSAEDKHCRDSSNLATCTETVSVESVSVVAASSCGSRESVMSSLHLSLTTCATGGASKRDLPLLSLPATNASSAASVDSKQDFPPLCLAVAASSSTPFSPQTPCSRFGSCVLPLNAAVDCAGIAGAVLCRWDNIVGPRIVYVWTTSVERRSWLAGRNVLSYIARGTLAGEVNRDPLNEVKFFASSDSDVALATIVFSCRAGDAAAAQSADAVVYSMSLIVPYCELATFLKLKSVCLEWLSRAVLQLRVLLSQVDSVTSTLFHASIVYGTATLFICFYLRLYIA